MWRSGAALLGALALAACATVTPPAPVQSDAYADYLIGRIANMRQDYGAASDRYFAALARTPGDEALLDGAVTASLAAGDEERARRAARMAPRQGGPAYAHIVRAADALSVQRWSMAATELERAEGSAAEELLARILLVWARTGQGNVDDVLVDLAPFAQIRPYGGLFAYQQALALDLAGRGEEALAAYRAADSGGLWLPAGIERHADLLARTGARDAAIALLDTDMNKQNPALAAALARAQAGQPVASERLTAARGAAIGLYGLAAVYQQESDTTHSLAATTLALMLDPNFDGARIAFAQQQARLGHVETARSALARVRPSSPYALTARTIEAWTLLDSGQEEEALAIAEANAADGDIRARRALADMYRSQTRFAEAEPIYSELIAQQQSDWRLYFARGVARERLGRWSEAEADLQRALELSPDQPDVLNYLGYSWVDRGERLEEGLALIRRAVELRPTSGAIIDSLGWAYYRMGDYAQALDYLERAVQLEPADPTLNDHLGDVYWRTGRRIEARFQWQRALTMSPDDPAAIQAKLDAGLPPDPPAHSAER